MNYDQDFDEFCTQNDMLWSQLNNLIHAFEVVNFKKLEEIKENHSMWRSRSETPLGYTKKSIEIVSKEPKIRNFENFESTTVF